MRRYWAVIIALGLGGHAAPCLAAPGANDGRGGRSGETGTPRESDDGAPTETGAQRELERHIQQRYAAAREAYKAGDLRSALDILKECYDVTHAVNLLFNMAQLYRELGECAAAVEHYRRYIAKEPNGERVADAKQLADSLEAQCAAAPVAVPTPASAIQREPVPQPFVAQDPVQEPMPAPAGAARPSSNHWAIIGWSALGVGAVATAVTVYESVAAAQAFHDVEHPEPSDGQPASYEYVEERQDDFHRSRRWALVAGSAAVASVALGIISLTVMAPRERAITHRMSAVVLPTGASIGYGVRF